MFCQMGHKLTGKANSVTASRESKRGVGGIVEFKHKKKILNKIAESNQDDPSLLSDDAQNGQY